MAHRDDGMDTLNLDIVRPEEDRSRLNIVVCSADVYMWDSCCGQGDLVGLGIKAANRHWGKINFISLILNFCLDESLPNFC